MKASRWPDKYIRKYSKSLGKSNCFHTKIKNKKKHFEIVDYGDDNNYLTLSETASLHCPSLDTAVDIGCRYGEFSRYLARNFAKIYCFDYRKTNQFAMNVDVLDRRIVHYTCPLGADMHTEYASGRGNFRNRNIDPKWRGLVQMQVYPLDYFKLTNVSLIKIDTDGMDEEVIKGAMNTIKKYKPVIIVELLIVDNKHNHNGVRLLQEIGYKVVDKKIGSGGMHNDYVLSYHKS